MLSPELEAQIRDIYENKIVFNAVLGLKITQLRAEEVRAEIRMKDELVGNYFRRRVHGGVISASLDAMGGLAILMAMVAQQQGQGVENPLAGFDRVGTISMNVDYLHAAVGERFALRAECMRLGARVGNTRMGFYAEDGKLLAAASASYIVS